MPYGSIRVTTASITEPISTIARFLPVRGFVCNGRSGQLRRVVAVGRSHLEGSVEHGQPRSRHMPGLSRRIPTVWLNDPLLDQLLKDATGQMEFLQTSSVESRELQGYAILNRKVRAVARILFGSIPLQ